ncbi:MAG: pilus assembly protein N-terminal domain-containing protein [Candidatus Omnitrophica bacterium]|nr:pilus assembly protein N-terminal domain-containing protein [Candidatus Omnitrophota bacterium]
MRYFKKILILFLAFAFFASSQGPLYGYVLIPEYLCETGVKLYKQGYLEYALREFKKALIANPYYKPAQKYVTLIEAELGKKEELPLQEPEIVVEAPVQEVKQIEAKPREIRPIITRLPEAKPQKVEIPREIKVVPEPETKPEPEKKIPEAKLKVEKQLRLEVNFSKESRDTLMEKTIQGFEEILSGYEIVPPAPEAAPVRVAAPAPIIVAPEPVIAKKPAPEILPVTPVAPARQPEAITQIASAPEREIAAPPQIILEAADKNLEKTLEIEQGKSVLISGKNIQKFLVTQPEVLNVQKRNADELLATADKFGYTYVHVWDDNGRRTLEFLTVPLKPVGPTYEEILRREEESSGTFKLRYSMEWNSFYTGKGISALKRSTYSYDHYLTLNGPTPYGDIDSNMSVRTLKANTNLNYLTLGITKGRLGPFEDFSLRLSDFAPTESNMAFTAPTLRGALFSSPAFHKTIDYSVFWGREGGGKYGALSPGLAKNKNSFLAGGFLNYFPTKNQAYGFSSFRGWGRDRDANLNDYSYDLYGKWKLFKGMDARYEVAYDSENLSQLFRTTYELPNLRLSNEVRNIEKQFMTMTGTGWRAGELGNLFDASYAPRENINIRTQLDMFRDRLFPNPKSPDTWNTDFNFDINWRPGKLTSVRADYSFQNELGRVAPFRSYNGGLGFYHTLEWFRRINTSLAFRHQDDRHFNSPNLDFTNEKANAGFRLNILKDFYYFLNEEFSWLRASYSGERSNPQVMETGVDWSSNITKLPFFVTGRFLWHDESDTTSALSFLSGEDYIEGYASASFHPTPDTELYCSTRVRNVWAENPNVNKRIEADFNAGLRYNWDTGIRWEPIGTIDGYVFRDINTDGLKTSGEEGLEGIRLWLGKRNVSTDKDGYYKFEKIRARKAYVNLDTQTLPAGFVLTVPVTQGAAVANHKNVRIDFGVNSRSEIWGIVFLDINNNGVFNLSDGDKGIKGVVFTLENGLKTVTDGNGQYRFPNVDVGEHTLTLSLNSLPIEYLPTVPLKKTIVLFEGVSYNYNFPVKKAQ